MKSILRTAVASVVSTLLINYDGAGSPLITGVQSLRIKSAIQQQSSVYLNKETHGPADSQFAQVKSQLKQKSASQVTSKVTTNSEAQSKTTAGVDSKAQWGFLKNIVNIDRFFSSGVDEKKSSGFAQQQSSKQQSHTQKTSPAQSHQSQASGKSEGASKASNSKNKLSQVKSKATEDMEEDQLMKEAEESQADDAVAESAAAEVAKSEDAKNQEAEQEIAASDKQNTQTSVDAEAGQTTVTDANEQTTQDQQPQQQEAQAPATPKAAEQPAAAPAPVQTQEKAQPAQPAAPLQQQPEQLKQQPQQAPAAAAQTGAQSAAEVIEQTQNELMKALNPTGKFQSEAEKQATTKMIQQLLEDVQKQALKGAGLPEGKSDAEKQQDKENEKNVKEFQESEKTRYKSKDEKYKHDEDVRNEGLLKQTVQIDKNQEIDLEIEAPGAANKVAEEGAQTSPPGEFQKLNIQLADARKKAENKLGTGGFNIEFKDPATFENSMKVLVFNDANKNEQEIKVENFDTHDTAQTQTASLAMAMSLQGDNGATIVDDQPGKESIIQNMNSDSAKMLSQIASGYSIRHDLVQKMAPGDKQYHMVSWDANKKFNNMKTFQKRPEAEKDYQALGSVPKILISGETGDVLLANGESSMVDQCLGMFYTQRYQGKYFGQP